MMGAAGRTEEFAVISNIRGQPLLLLRTIVVLCGPVVGHSCPCGFPWNAHCASSSAEKRQDRMCKKR